MLSDTTTTQPTPQDADRAPSPAPLSSSPSAADDAVNALTVIGGDPPPTSFLNNAPLASSLQRLADAYAEQRLGPLVTTLPSPSAKYDGRGDEYREECEGLDPFARSLPSEDEIDQMYQQQARTSGSI